MKLAVLLSITLLSTTSMAMSQKAPAIEVPQKVEAKPSPSPSPTTESALSPVEDIKRLALGTACSKYRFKDQGIAPTSYLQGIALSLARAQCSPDPITDNGIFGPAKKDALAYYQVIPSNIAVYTLLIGVGMRESSGGVNCGRDTNASNTSADTAESGTFQTSWNVTVDPDTMKTDQGLVAIYDAYKSGKKSCFQKEYTATVSCKQSQLLKNWGKAGPGLEFQKLAKSCPAFATEFAARTLRVRRTHYGTVNTKAAEYKTECEAMLTSVSEYVGAHPSACAKLN